MTDNFVGYPVRRTVCCVPKIAHTNTCMVHSSHRCKVLLAIGLSYSQPNIGHSQRFKNPSIWQSYFLFILSYSYLYLQHNYHNYPRQLYPYQLLINDLQKYWCVTYFLLKNTDVLLINIAKVLYTVQLPVCHLLIGRLCHLSPSHPPTVFPTNHL